MSQEQMSLIDCFRFNLLEKLHSQHVHFCAVFTTTVTQYAIDYYRTDLHG